jgi:hybrid cluster-associated redox disulfide protein
MTADNAKDQDPAHWTVETLLANRPEAAEVLFRHGMACVGCVMARFETVAEAARVYQVDLRSLLKEMRETRAGRPRRETRRTSRGYRSHERCLPEEG